MVKVHSQAVTYLPSRGMSEGDMCMEMQMEEECGISSYTKKI